MYVRENLRILLSIPWGFLPRGKNSHGVKFLQAKVPMGKMLFLYPCLNDKKMNKIFNMLKVNCDKRIIHNTFIQDLLYTMGFFPHGIKSPQIFHPMGKFESHRNCIKQ